MKRLILIAALLLTGCGNSDGDTHTSAPEPGPPAPMADAFLAQVQTVAATQPEESEAANIDALAATEPEDSEPVPL
jgi:outer membrane PBP1 activator LpoA protein